MVSNVPIKGSTMSSQDIIVTLTMIGMGLVALGFVWVILQSRKAADTPETQEKLGKSKGVRKVLFATLIVIFIGAGFGTLIPFPDPPQHSPLNAKQVVTVVGHQWFWEMSTDQVLVNQPVEFAVTSADVNHGFAIYGPDEKIVTQTQAMPGYTNKVVWTFKQPGTYIIRCLEYCGLVHHAMESPLTVVTHIEAEGTDE